MQLPMLEVLWLPQILFQNGQRSWKIINENLMLVIPQPQMNCENYFITTLIGSKNIIVSGD